MRDFEIHIRAGTAEEQYPVDVYVREEDRRAEGIVHLPWDNVEIERVLAWVEGGGFDARDARQFGTQLFRALFHGRVKDVYEASRAAITSGAGLLRYRLIVDAPAAARVPWELLFDPTRKVFLALESAVVRGVSSIEATRLLKVGSPLHVLLATANPKGVLKLATEREVAGVEAAFDDLTRISRARVSRMTNATLPRLQDALREATNAGTPCHILHFIGHGAYDAEARKTVLLFEKNDGSQDRVEAQTLRDIVAPYDLKLVFLNACRTLGWAVQEATRAFAPILLESGIPAVIGMQLAVADEAAVAFAVEFYSAMVDNQPVDSALSDARRVVRGNQGTRGADLAIPVCYLRTQTGLILDMEQPPTRHCPHKKAGNIMESADQTSTGHRTARRTRETASAGVYIGGNVGDHATIAGRDISKDNVTMTTGSIGGGAQVQLAGHDQQAQRADLSPAERAELDRLLADLVQRLGALNLTADAKEDGQYYAGQIEAELKKPTGQPDPGVLRRAGSWLVKNTPALAGTVIGLFVNPIVGKVVEAAGDLAAQWVKERAGARHG